VKAKISSPHSDSVSVSFRIRGVDGFGRCRWTRRAPGWPLRCLSEVDALGLKHPPGRFQLGPAGEHPAEGFDPVGFELVERGQLEVAAAEDLAFECWP